MRSQAHRIEPEPPLDLVYLIQCLACLALIFAAFYGAILVGWVVLG